MLHFGQYTVTISQAVTSGVALVSIVVAIISLSMARSSRKRISRLMGVPNYPSLEEGLGKVFEEAKSWPPLVERIEELERRQRRSLSRTGMVRYNPFDDTGADLSFSLAVLSDEQDGLVLTSLWGRDEVRVYAKPIKQGVSRYALSNEEKQAVALACNQRVGSRPEEVK
ncbi:MAG: DUF4446 family protein [Firmicutes bacterium]|nr:DUF4446 family protein [Bacillota bacterium]